MAVAQILCGALDLSLLPASKNKRLCRLRDESAVSAQAVEKLRAELSAGITTEAQVHIRAYRRAWGFCVFRQQARGGGTDEVGGAGSGWDGRAGECHCARTDRNSDTRSLHENRGKKGWFGLDRAAKTRGETRRDCSSYRSCFLRQNLFHHGSHLKLHIEICNARTFRFFAFAYFFRAHC